jgi:hypothetical protein
VGGSLENAQGWRRMKVRARPKLYDGDQITLDEVERISI